MAQTERIEGPGVYSGFHVTPKGPIALLRIGRSRGADGAMAIGVHRQDVP
jgi:hypothetical protein